MVKKLIAAGATAATILVLAGGAAFATSRHHRGSWTKNTAVVSGNTAAAVANTGLNFQIGGDEQEMETGDAIATAGQDVVVNSTSCNCEGRRGFRWNEATVSGNSAVALANTGLNFQVGGERGLGGPVALNREGGEGENHHRHHSEDEQEMETGDADAFAWQTFVVNSSLAHDAE